MIRNKTSNDYPKVKRIKSLFWKECRFCNLEFKREYGYEIEDYKQCRAVSDYPYETYYCCSNCADSEDKVKELINQAELDFLSRRPRIPKQR